MTELLLSTPALTDLEDAPVATVIDFPEPLVDSVPPIQPPAPPMLSAAGADDFESMLRQSIKNIMHDELTHILSDVEFRLRQTQDTLARFQAEGGTVLPPGANGGMVYAEDTDLLIHQLTGFTITPNTPANGSVAWASLHDVYNGTDYAITDGNTANKYIWFDPAVSTSVLQTSNTKPTLTGSAVMLWVNTNGTPVQAVQASMPPVLRDGAVDSGAITANAVLNSHVADGAVTPAKTSFYTSLASAVTAAQNAADLAQATADGSVTTYFQAAAPWANGDATAGGASNPATKVGDIWYRSTDGQAMRWSGASGSPANTWVTIDDSDIAAALSAANNAQAGVNVKTTTYYSVAATAPTAPTPPAGNGFTTGDFWVVTDQGNLIRRWSGSAWVDLAIGTGAIATGAVTDAKVASGISGGKLTAGTVTDTQIGTGISGGKLTAGSVTDTQIGGVSGTKIASGTVGATALGSGAVTPVKLNVLQHTLY